MNKCTFTILLLAMFAVSACKRPADSSSTGSDKPAASAAPSPTQGMAPHDPDTAAAKPATGPAEAGTAVGGMTGGQGQGGASFKTPQASGGDGSTK